MQDGICSVSFGDPAVMTLTHVMREDPPELTEQGPPEQQVGMLGATRALGCSSLALPLLGGYPLTHPSIKQVLLRGGDLLFLHSAARYDWAHGIASMPCERYSGTVPDLSRFSAPQSCEGRLRPAAGTPAVEAGCAPGADRDKQPAAAAGEIAEAEEGTLLLGKRRQRSSEEEEEAVVEEVRDSGREPAALPDSGAADAAGLLVVRGTRVSVTFRRLCRDIVLSEPA